MHPWPHPGFMNGLPFPSRWPSAAPVHRPLQLCATRLSKRSCAPFGRLWSPLPVQATSGRGHPPLPQPPCMVSLPLWRSSGCSGAWVRWALSVLSACRFVIVVFRKSVGTFENKMLMLWFRFDGLRWFGFKWLLSVFFLYF